mmetsp:Transcript_39771/g.71535  ORF Transcript_39771/g.71535 Transcript_39771/m.71535 type:complete len:223 (+) Transcript_39771:34-702(+)|eukprot:CAMPEP_0197662442 /NCGR_PEP_ID=MMETSP1338-20131121/53427_1 /TAXON_ID=43686 ORGANISM="Pelagodinium beii, Strain RCC1491" /NCGR_SAMPLE_ID=MMETSP1338 /ASSEMBLY_ACC=CAM_ASM_000754 /LENGTH=222 /DNA_ID=CAMNT_0043240297 /DNA_START=34 /DNA_END=702 /DNA_ORIENTATION=-
MAASRSGSRALAAAAAVCVFFVAHGGIAFAGSFTPRTVSPSSKDLKLAIEQSSRASLVSMRFTRTGFEGTKGVPRPKLDSERPNLKRRWQRVRQWKPEAIPARERRAPEDRIRIKFSSTAQHILAETAEIIEDFAKDIGGEVEGPYYHEMESKHVCHNKSPKGHKKAKRHHWVRRYIWTMDFYPPKSGGLEAVMNLRVPHTVKMEILDPMTVGYDNKIYMYH